MTPELALVAVDSSALSDGAKLENCRRRHQQNPFLVLELPPTADGAEVDRQGQKLLAMLAAEMSEAGSYPTPLGHCPRTPELVRAAMAELQDPDRRLLAEWWVRGWGRDHDDHEQ
jgi:hypothetical protein